MTKRKKPTQKKWLIIVLLTATVLVALVVMALLNQQSITAYSASEYFAFTEISAVGRSISQNNNNSILIQLLFFELTPIKGDAHHVVIFAGMTDPQEYAYDQILNGTKMSVEIQLGHGISSRKQIAGYPIRIRMQSDEAIGYVTLLIPENNIIL